MKPGGSFYFPWTSLGQPHLAPATPTLILLLQKHGSEVSVFPNWLWDLLSLSLGNAVLSLQNFLLSLCSVH